MTVATRTKRGIAERCLRLMQDRAAAGQEGWDILPDRPATSQFLERLDTVEASLMAGTVDMEVEGYVEEPEFDDAGNVAVDSRGQPKTRRVRTHNKVWVTKDLTAVQRLELREERTQLAFKIEARPKQCKDIVSFLTYGADYLLERFSFENLKEELPNEAALKLLFPKECQFASFDYEKVLQNKGVHVDQIEVILQRHYPEDFKRPSG